MGRYSYSHRSVLENSAAISVRDLTDRGLLKKLGTGRSEFTVTSSCKGLLGAVTMDVSMGNREHLSKDNYIKFDIAQNGVHHVFSHPIETQPVHLGGYRFFFKCTCSKNGVYCGKRVRSLYFGGRVYACRHCLELVYQKCRYHKSIMCNSNSADALEKKAEKLRKTNHPRLANRLMKKAAEYRHRSDLRWSIHISTRYGHLLNRSQ